MSPDVLDRLGDIDQADVVRCARVLLRRPLLRAGGPEAELLPIVYRHRATLTEPTWPAAPPRLSTTTVCASASAKPMANSRPTMSVPPPAA